MANLARRWAGTVFGTNTGNLYAQFDVVADEVKGTIRLMDTAFGLTVFQVAGTYTTKLRLKGEPIQTPPGIQAGALEIEAVLTPDGSLRGEWKTSFGTAGTFSAFPHDIPEAGAATQQVSGRVPEQVYMATIKLGALRLYGADVLTLIQFIRREFFVGRTVVTYKVRGNEVSKYAEEFEKELPNLGELRYLKINIQEPEAHGINKVVVVELNSEGQNEVRTQGIHEPWVVGTAEAISRTLRASERFLVTTWKKFGLGLNQIIFLSMLVLLPEITAVQYRAAFVVLVVMLLGVLVLMHQRLIPNLIVYPKASPSAVQRLLPSVVSWIATVASALVAAFVFYWFSGKTP